MILCDFLEMLLAMFETLPHLFATPSEMLEILFTFETLPVQGKTFPNIFETLPELCHNFLMYLRLSETIPDIFKNLPDLLKIFAEMFETLRDLLQRCTDIFEILTDVFETFYLG